MSEANKNPLLNKFIFWIGWKILMFFLGNIILAGVIILLTLIIFVGIYSYTKQQAVNQIIANSMRLDLPEPLNQQKIIIDGVEYGLPLISNQINKTEKLALTAIRLAEWGYLKENSTVGDLNSCGAYQQLMTEYSQSNSVIGQKIRELLGDKFNAILPESRLNWLIQNKNRQRFFYPVTSSYGYRQLTVANSNFHYGVDIGYSDNTPVSTPENGIVREVTFDFEGGGNVIVIEHPQKNIRTLYGHLNQALVKVGDNVITGQVIALSGNTGQSTGSHLHFQIINNLSGPWNQNTINPNQEPIWLGSQLDIITTSCLALTNIHLRTGLFDYIALERLKNEPAGKQALEVGYSNIDNFLNLLCQSQRPVNCTTWTTRSKDLLIKSNLLS